jgi:IS4 transposase
MVYNAQTIRTDLNRAIKNIEQNLPHFVQHPTDFTRKRQLSATTLIRFLIGIEGKSLESELLHFFNFSPTCVSASALHQARKKLKLDAFQAVFDDFLNSPHPIKTFQTFQLLAVDGSEVALPKNEQDTDTFVSQRDSGHNLLHINAFYDLLNKEFVCFEFQGKAKTDERDSLIRLTAQRDHSVPSLLIADRGFESFNLFEHLKRLNQKFLIRVKDKTSRSFLSHISLPEADEFDTQVHFELTRRQTQAIKSDPNFCFLSNFSKFDFLPEQSKISYPINLRIIRFKVEQDTYEALATNLTEEEMSTEKLKQLYHLRWGIETAFRELKFALGLTLFHSKNKRLILQEIIARFILYNFSMRITMQVAIKCGQRKYGMQVNFTRAFGNCRQFFREKSLDIEILIGKYLLPIRPDRKSKRKVKVRTFAGYLYRMG